MVVALIVLIVVGCGLTAAGLRGRRTDDHPLCRRCRFDLTGRPTTAERRCPECGADLARPRAVVVGHRRRRTALLTGGLAVSVPTLTLIVTAFYRLSTRDYWYPYAPVFYLASEARAADSSRHDPAMAEVVRRSKAGTLSDWDCRRLADTALACQGDPAQPWDDAWGDLLERFRAEGRLADERWARYAMQALAGSLDVEVRPVVRSGDPLPFASHLTLKRAATRTRLRVDVRPASSSFAVENGAGGPRLPGPGSRAPC